MIQYSLSVPIVRSKHAFNKYFLITGAHEKHPLLLHELVRIYIVHATFVQCYLQNLI